MMIIEVIKFKEIVINIFTDALTAAKYCLKYLIMSTDNTLIGQRYQIIVLNVELSNNRRFRNGYR
jgi:hypothetical protein